MNSYKVLNKQSYSIGDYSIVPIRFEDRYDIMKWRNEQIYHLRQSKPLTESDQERYFSNVVSKLFEEETPNQLLFSYLKNGECIGYGGLVHINWLDKNAEISFIMNTELEKNFFGLHWQTFLRLIQKIAFEDLSLHKIYTFAFDLRPHLYEVIEKCGFIKEAVLKEHCIFNYEFKDVVIHSIINKLRLRIATTKDNDKTFEWATDPQIRKYSFNQSQIRKEEHGKWFKSKIEDHDCHYYILENILGTPLGSIRLDLNENEAMISYLIDSSFFGKGLGTEILILIEDEIVSSNLKPLRLVGLVQKENAASIRIFNKLGYNTTTENGVLKFTKIIQ
ncbi:GNAT family N-acetyltransferase [Paenimyroides aestuarii]|uniref:GNAT family N-acetyltransferase n=1 Tax=Paenimyroides aestuarii TaxID=2968490 RepID=A0ABY5NRT2_9FLAO|nr:GNAT family N-acetyltransferase [Paenimyroides aestuarii]UUV21276.1 GNAT family N-acetyltransferase [Paenimyroides aestuarii]